MLRSIYYMVLCCFVAVLIVPAQAHEVDMTKLPLGDGKISHAPKAGWIWACHVDPNGGGAHRVGPWIDQKAKTFDFTAKTVVRGSVMWPHKFDVTLKGDKRLLTSNDLPDHPTGRFPIARNDPAYRFDRNPNRIRSRNFKIELPAHPKLAQARCAPGVVGILLSGVALFNALDAPGRDAVAHETQDRCQGHPQRSGTYHYHSLTNCIDGKPGADGNSTLIGYALDGFGIYGRYADGRALSTADLDACHGRTGVIDWDGKKVEMYHYVATPDFPYTVGCLRGAYDRSLVRKIGGDGPPGRRGMGPPPGGGPPPFGGPPPR
ncbi:MAG: YHYH protein [Pseudolabrys sp.]|nr:YHYH protein [Pseudolabrys sp.]